MSEMVEVVVDSIRVSLVSQQQVVLLRERDANRYLPIWIGAFEANAIQLALHEVELARPMTHDLMRRLLDVLEVRLERAEVVALKENTFYGNLVISHQGRTYHVDSRPSDAIALAVRAHIPIFVAREVMEEAGIVPEQDLEEAEEKTERPTPPPSERLRPEQTSSPSLSPPSTDEADEDRLSVFADFLDQIETDEADDADRPEDVDSV